jgi:hypothetical protein
MSGKRPQRAISSATFARRERAVPMRWTASGSAMMSPTVIRGLSEE